MSRPCAWPRLAYLTGEFPAVSHTFILREIEALRDLGFEVETCSVRRTGPEHHRGLSEKAAAASTFYLLAAARNPLRLLAAQAAALTAPARYFGTLAQAWRLRTPGLRAALYQLFYFVEATLLARHLQQRGVGHLHNHFAGPSATVAMLAARLAGLPFSFTLHGPADLAEPVRWRLTEKIAAARFVACISHYSRSQAMMLSDPAHWENLSIVHCGVLPEMYETPAARNGDAGLHLLFVGRLAAVKGLRVLFEALGRLDGVRLILVGDGPDRAALEAAAAPLGDAVTFLGYQSQEEVAEHLCQVDALVLPSFAEGVPVVLMEAMAAGLPVVASRITGVPELVTEGESGYLVPPGDPQALAAALRDLAGRTPADRLAMGAVGRGRVREDFDVRIEAARLGALFTGAGQGVLRPAPIAAPEERPDPI